VQGGLKVLEGEGKVPSVEVPEPVWRQGEPDDREQTGDTADREQAHQNEILKENGDWGAVNPQYTSRRETSMHVCRDYQRDTKIALL